MAQAESNPIILDQVAVAGRELVALRRQANELDERIARARSGAHAEELRAELDHLWERITATEKRICGSRATSLEGALVQLGMAVIEVESMATFLPEDEDPSVPWNEARRIVDRALFSIAGVLKAALGGDAAVMEFSDLDQVASNIDPWRKRAA